VQHDKIITQEAQTVIHHSGNYIILFTSSIRQLPTYVSIPLDLTNALYHV